MRYPESASTNFSAGAVMQVFWIRYLRKAQESFIRTVICSVLLVRFLDKPVLP